MQINLGQCFVDYLGPMIFNSMLFELKKKKNTLGWNC